METNEIRFLGDLQRLRPEPGDVFVLTCEGRLSAESADHLRRYLAEALNGAKVLVLDSGLRIGCVAVPE